MNTFYYNYNIYTLPTESPIANLDPSLFQDYLLIEFYPDLCLVIGASKS